MYFELKENRPHGTPENPFSQYHISDVKRAFQIPVHWHDELEIIYVKQGKLHVTISGENYIGSPKDAFVVSPGSLHFMGSPTGDADYYTFLFPLEYISFQTDDLMEKSILSPLKRGRLMISPQINDTAADICERLIEINAQISGKNAENTDAANIEAQFETKITLIKFIRKMWRNGLILENGTNGINTTEKEMITYIWQNYTRAFSYNSVTVCQSSQTGACQTAIGGISSFRYRGCDVQWISECELFYTQLQENVWGITS